jgi:hypothetical protein
MAATQARPEEWDNAQRFEDIPGPKPLPVIGNAWRFIPYLGKLLFRYVIMGYAHKLREHIRLYMQFIKERILAEFNTGGMNTISLKAI